AGGGALLPRPPRGGVTPRRRVLQPEPPGDVDRRPSSPRHRGSSRRQPRSVGSGGAEATVGPPRARRTPWGGDRHGAVAAAASHRPGLAGGDDRDRPLPPPAVLYSSRRTPCAGPGRR